MEDGEQKQHNGTGWPDAWLKVGVKGRGGIKTISKCKFDL